MSNVDGGQFITTQSAPEVPATFELGQNYPNPFNPTTQIPFEIKEAGNVTLKVYDMTGREVATLSNGYQSVGSHTVTFRRRRSSLRHLSLQTLRQRLPIQPHHGAGKVGAEGVPPTPISPRTSGGIKGGF
jgi:hypothetical protein